jgi:hypothetical protein
VQLPFATGKSFTVDGLREKLRDFSGRRLARNCAPGRRSTTRSHTVLISFNWQVALIGLQLRILNGVVSLLTT